MSVCVCDPGSPDVVCVCVSALTDMSVCTRLPVSARQVRSNLSVFPVYVFFVGGGRQEHKWR